MLSGSRVEDIHDRIIRAVRDFFAQAGMSRAVLGLSGGLDSAVVAALAAEALGKEQVTGILMPSSWSTVHSVNDAVELADNLGIKYHIIPIGAIYDRFMKEAEPLFEGDFHWDTTQENLQARIRGTITPTGTEPCCSTPPTRASCRWVTAPCTETCAVP